MWDEARKQRSAPALVAERALLMSWQAAGLLLTRAFAAEAEDFPPATEGFGGFLGLHHNHHQHQHHHQQQLSRIDQILLCASVPEG